jgi:predicted nucleic acid-binding protein
VIVDASVVLRGFFPDEKGQAQAQALIREHALGRLELAAPTLLSYEMANAVLQAARRGRITEEQAGEILDAFENLGIELMAVTLQRTLALARRFDRSAYDAAYLALAEATGRPLVTGDLRLYNAVYEHLHWVQWIGDYVVDSGIQDS